MATPVKKIKGRSLLVKIGDGSSPETFTHDCLINTTRGIQFSSETTRSMVPFCDAPDDPSWQDIEVDGLSASISGAGTLHTASAETWFNWFKSGLAKNIRVEYSGVLAADGGGYWQGAFKLTGWNQSGDRRENVTSDVTLESHGEVTWTDASA